MSLNLGKPAIFLSRIIDTTDGRRCVQVFRQSDTTKAADDSLWEIVFVGTEDECGRFSRNMHHSIDPNMANAETVINPKRVVQ